MRIFDTFIVAEARDLDLAEARFAELRDLDVVHVIAEATADYRGQPKPLHFWDERHDRFWPYHGRWNHVRVEASELPAGADPKTRKDALREYLAHGITAEPGDIILHGGAGEIPAARVVRELAEGRIPVPVALEMRCCAYTPRLIHPVPWRGTVAQEWRNAGSLAGMRDKRTVLPAIINAGTRLSMWGEEPQAVHPDGQVLRDAEPDGTWPRWVLGRQRQHPLHLKGRKAPGRLKPAHLTLL